MMLIADETDIDPRLNLEFGPCDFVVYPFSVRDLVLRIDAIIRLRREMARAAESHRTRRAGRYLVGRLEIDADRQIVQVDGVPVALSVTELRVLIYLIKNRDRVCSRTDLLVDVWGYRPGIMSRAADVHVTRLRAKLGVAGNVLSRPSAARAIDSRRNIRSSSASDRGRAVSRRRRDVRQRRLGRRAWGRRSRRS